MPPQFFVCVHVSGGCFRRRMSNQDGDTTATVPSPVSRLPTAPWSRKRRRQESALKLRQKKRLVEQTDVTRPGPSSPSTFGLSDKDLIAPPPVPRDHDRDCTALIIAPIYISRAVQCSECSGVQSHVLHAIFVLLRRNTFCLYTYFSKLKF